MMKWWLFLVCQSHNFFPCFCIWNNLIQINGKQCISQALLNLPFFVFMFSASYFSHQLYFCFSGLHTLEFGKTTDCLWTNFKVCFLPLLSECSHSRKESKSESGFYVFPSCILAQSNHFSMQNLLLNTPLTPGVLKALWIPISPPQPIVTVL